MTRVESQRHSKKKKLIWITKDVKAWALSFKICMKYVHQLKS